MRDVIKVRLYAAVVVRVPVDTEIGFDEFREWYEEDGDAFDLSDLEADAILEYVTSSPDNEYEIQAQMPKPDVDVHEVMSSEFEEAEVLL